MTIDPTTDPLYAAAKAAAAVMEGCAAGEKSPPEPAPLHFFIVRAVAAALVEGSGINGRTMRDCARREVAMRESIYPDQVRCRKLNPLKAEQELKAMRAIADMVERMTGER